MQMSAQLFGSFAASCSDRTVSASPCSNGNVSNSVGWMFQTRSPRETRIKTAELDITATDVVPTPFATTRECRVQPSAFLAHWHVPARLAFAAFRLQLSRLR